MAVQLIRWVAFESWLGPALAAATDAGLCRLAFDEGEAELRQRFPDSRLIKLAPNADSLIEAAAYAVEHPAEPFEGNLDTGGTAFERACWQAVRAVPPGTTQSYAQIAIRIGHPATAARAVGTANGRNPIAVIIPCHRLIRRDGGLGGYAYGLARKRALLERELAKI